MAATCPVCREPFDAPAAFALHVAACTAVPDGASGAASVSTAATVATAALATPTASCPMCHMVYTSAMAPHEIEFHEEECERVNEYTGPIVPMRLDANGSLRGDGSGGGGGSSRPTSGAKRTREAADATSVGASSAATGGPRVKLFPAQCAVCDAGGRTLLHCAGTCARTFHPLCIEEMNVARDFAANGNAPVVMSSAGTASAGGSVATAAAGGSVSFASAITRDKKAQKAWVCGECTRGLHTCQLCGFLGHEGHEIVRCSLPDCGFFFHPACLREQNFRALSPLVCPRHTCTACHVIETDMSKCSSCTKCCKSIHIHCRDAVGASAATATQTRGRGDVLDPNFHICDAHSSDSSSTTSPERKAAQFVGLKVHTRPGDVVLILEYGNLLLPSTAKEIAPEAYNQWGVVQRVENLGDGISSAWWTQLLTVTLFSDDSSISVPNRYVLPIGSIRQYTSPTNMVRDAIKWHAMSEIRVRQLEKQRSGSTTSQVMSTTSSRTLLGGIILAFKQRAETLGLSSTACLENAGDGFASWQRFADSSSRTYGSTVAPVYIALDTRGRNKPDMETATTPRHYTQFTHGPQEGAGDENDVDMEDAANSSAQNQGGDDPTSTSAVGGVRDRKTASAVAYGMMRAEVFEVVARLVEGVETRVERGRLLGGSVESVLVATDDSTVDSPAIVNDVVMDEVVELPAMAQSEGEVDGHEYENRLSMDDLLNPLSQETHQSPAFEGTPRPSDPLTAPVNQQEVLRSVQADENIAVKVPKRPLETGDVAESNPINGIARAPISEDHATKKVKLVHEEKSGVVVNFSHLPPNFKKPRSSVFGRIQFPVLPTMTQKQKLAAEYPSAVLRDLQQQVDRFFEAEEGYKGQQRKGFSTVRPAFYRPTPFLYRSARVGRRADSISRVLLCQDKRNLKCFLRASSTSTKSKPSFPRLCPYDVIHNDRVSYVSIDLLGISSFSSLEKEVLCRVANAVMKKERSTGWHWQSATGTNVTIEDEFREPEIHLTYCAYDGSEHALPVQKMHRQQQPEWLCFCANVVHLTATVIHP